MRGNLPAAISSSRGRRSIPACAGEPPPLNWPNGQPTVYPRVCGGTRRNRKCTPYAVRSIPACAGEPSPVHPRPHKIRVYPRVCGEPVFVACACSHLRVYPRVCGGTGWMMSVTMARIGLSPRVRGNHLQRPRVRHGRRSIPACAGGTLVALPLARVGYGLSPRVRGNP